MIVSRMTLQASAGPAAGQDEVISFAPMPEGSRLLNVHGELHLIGAEGSNTRYFTGYGFGGEFIPDTDIDTVNSMDSMWDKYVTKSVVATPLAATTMVDWDWDTADPNSFLEPGELDINDLVNFSNPTKEIFAPRLEMLSYAKGAPTGVTAESPDKYTPRDFKTFNSSRRLVADMDGWAMLALARPAFDKRTGSARNTYGNAYSWAILRNLRNVLGDFWRINTGMVDSGAESPYDLISAAVQDLVVPVVQDDVGLFFGLDFNYLTKVTWTIDYPGDSIPKSIKAQF